MAEETSALAEVTLTPAAEHEWELLRELVDFADRLAVAFIFADRFAVRVLRARMQREAHEHGMPFRLVTCDTPDTLRESALGAILTPAAEHEVTWLEAFGSEAELRGAWFFAAQRWNEHREPLRRSTLRALIVAAPLWAKPVIRLAAPDLWSITNLVIEPTALPSTTTLEAPELADRHEGTPAERALAERAVEEALALGEGGLRTWALIQAVIAAFRAGALEAAERAADILDLTSEALEHLAADRRMAGDRPGVVLSDLGASLANLGLCLSNLGRDEEALKAEVKAVEIFRDLARARPSTYLPGLATSLNNLAYTLDAVGSREDALAVVDEAVNIFRDLARDRPAEFLPKLAVSLSSLGNSLGMLQNHRAALEGAREAVGISRTLAREQPRAFSEVLAMNLNNLGIWLSKLGLHEDALATADETVGIYRNLARDRPAEFLPGLAGSLNNLSKRLSELGHLEDALAAAEESVELTTGLARSKPRVFLPKLDLCALNLIARLEDAHRPLESSPALRDAQALLAATRSELESVRSQDP